LFFLNGFSRADNSNNKYSTKKIQRKKNKSQKKQENLGGGRTSGGFSRADNSNNKSRPEKIQRKKTSCRKNKKTSEEVGQAEVFLGRTKKPLAQEITILNETEPEA
jgi:hypothetical protein